MKKTYAFVVNERTDDKIERAVKDIFADYGSSISLGVFRALLGLKLNQATNLVELVRLERTPLQDVERQYKATAYRVIDDVIYKIDLENS
ncbi:MAG TPA: hypothetical protein VJJ52_07010 [Candidatus Nanoarchaeia archaeon]|nr:hypothetical protein [Candidatus Nanoarchaeia archaeon]